MDPGQKPTVMQKSQEINDVTDLTGSFGRWQLSVFVVVYYLEVICHAMSDLTLFLVPNSIDYWCQGSERASGTPCWTKRSGGKEKCTAWQYDRTVFTSTIVEKWDLVCDKSWLVSFSMTVTAFGFFCGCLLSGRLGDQIGRRRTMLFLTVPALLSQLGTSAAPSINVFLFCRFLAGLSAYAITTCGYVLLTELVGAESRPMTGILVKTGASLGKIYMCLMGYTLGKWNYIQLSVTLPALLIPFLCWNLPESPRWSILNNRSADATKTIVKAHKINGLHDENILEKVESFSEKTKQLHLSENRSNHTFLDLFRTRTIRMKTFILLFIWTVPGFVGFGIGSNVNVFGKNSLVGVLALSSAGLPGEMIAAAVVRKVGSRQSVMLGLVALSLTAFSCSLTENSSPALQIILVTIIQSLVAFVYCSLFLQTVEVFPTVLRVAGLGACSTITKIPGMVAPYINDMRLRLGYSSPFLLFTSLASLAVLILTFLPKQQRTILLETLKDDEETHETHVA